MPVFAYKGVLDSGRATKGFVDAESDRSARSKLKKDGIFLTELSESARGAKPDAEDASSNWNVSFEGFRQVPQTDVAIATRQLATLLGAGIPLVESLGALTEQVEHARLKGILARVRDRVNEGTTFGDALAASGAFSDLYVSMVKAGETGGALEIVLLRLADYLETSVRTRNRVVTIVTYPLFMLVLALLVTVVLVTVVLPQVTELVTRLDAELPWITTAVLGTAEFFKGNFLWIVAVIGLSTLGVVSFVRTEAGTRIFDRVKISTPVAGRLVRLMAVSRFTRTLSTLLAGGVPIVKALETSRHVTGNLILGEAIERAKESITEGSTIAAPLKASGQFPPLVTHMVDVGERTGELEAMLQKVAEAYDEQVENAVTRMTALLEPILILGMVGVVLVITLAVLQPLMQATQGISQ
jgi:general secretion pathway protein F